MACSTCDHTMQKINTQGSASRWFWCPRCGTIMEEFPTAEGEEMDISVPKLVERCREFIAETGDDKKHCRGLFPVDIKRHWHVLGIAESIHIPEQRPEAK